jgi:hypothetical protein
MAYNNAGSKFSKPANAAARTDSPRADAPRSGGSGSPATGAKPELLLSTGLFRPKSEKSKALASVVTEITQDIKAGTVVYIDVYANEEAAEGKPTHKVQMKKRA